MSVKAILGSNIKYYRKKQRLSQEQLAEKLEITPKHLSTIETGATFVSAELLENFIRELHVSASALFFSVDEVSADDSLFNKIDHIIENEFAKSATTIKTQIRCISSVSE